MVNVPLMSPCTHKRMHIHNIQDTKTPSSLSHSSESQTTDYTSLNCLMHFELTFPCREMIKLSIHIWHDCFQNESISIQKTHLLCDACIVDIDTVAAALGDPRRERPPAVYGHVTNVPTHFNVKLPPIGGHLPDADSHLLVVCTAITDSWTNAAFSAVISILNLTP